MKKIAISAALCTAALFASAAYAGPSKTVTTTVASENDVKLVLEAADMFEYLGKVNTQGVQSSDPFEDEFVGDWNAIGAFGSDGLATGANGLIKSPLSFTFNMAGDKKSGTWSVTNTLKDFDVTLDLVFAMHTGGGSGAWLFDNHKFLANTTQDGTWVQRMLNGGGNPGAFSNLTLFASDMTLKKKDLPPPDDSTTDLPEPATLGSLLLGLGMIGFMGRRRKQS